MSKFRPNINYDFYLFLFLCRISQYATAEELTVSTLKIVSLETEKFGNYFCKANNKMGHAEARINVFGKIFF